MGYTLSVSGNDIIFDVTHVDGCDYYRLFLRYTEDTVVENMLWYQYEVVSSTDFQRTYTNAESGRSYTGNVAYAPAENGPWTFMGAEEVDTGDGSRPSNWSWTSTIVSGYPVPVTADGSLAPITADEWNAFCARINEFREYKSLETVSFATVTPGIVISYSVINRARTAISSIPGAGTVPSGSNAIEAGFYQQLAAALNAVS